MAERGLFERALGLEWPWRVERTEFDAAERRLDLHLDFEPGGTFDCPSCGRGGCKAHDASGKRWRHLDFFQHRAYPHARVPRVRCPACGVKQARVPWAEPGSGFTLWFEALAVALAREMPVRAVARLVGEHDTRLWRLLKRHVGESRAEADFSGGRAGGIRDLCMDMSAAYMKGAREAFPEAGITFDRFHVQRLMNRAVDEVRRQERKERPELNRTRLSVAQEAEQAHRLSAAVDRRTARSVAAGTETALVYRIKLAFEAFRDLPPRLAEAYLQKWCSWAGESGLQPVIDAAKTIAKHWDGHPPLVPLKDQQRHDRGHQLARPSRQGQGPRLPAHRELHHHRLSRVRQTELQTTHLKQRGTSSSSFHPSSLCLALL